MLNQLKQLEPNGVKLKIAVNAPQPYIADTDELVATGTTACRFHAQHVKMCTLRMVNGKRFLALCFLTGAEVRGVDLQSVTGGILHTKLWVVDKKHVYLGSANMDWRSLTQVCPNLVTLCHYLMGQKFSVNMQMCMISMHAGL